MARPLYLQPGFIALVVTLFVVSFYSDTQSKRILTQHPSLPITLTWFQFFWSAVSGYALLLVTRGGVPSLPTKLRNCLPLLPMTLVQSLGAFTTTQSFGAMAVGFTHTVKATEPVFTAIFARMLGDRFSMLLYLSLLPIICGVILTALTEISFSWFGVGMALISNACFAARAVFIGRQVAIQKQREAALDEKRKGIEAARRPVESNLDTTTSTTAGTRSRPRLSASTLAAARLAVPSYDAATASPGGTISGADADVDAAAKRLRANSQGLELRLDPAELHLDDVSMFFFVCTFSCLLMLPLLLLEWSSFTTIVLAQYRVGSFELFWQLTVAGVGQYTYTLCSLIILSRTSPITHVVMHSLRRVYVIYFSIYLRDGGFQSVSKQSLLGTAAVLIGALWFAREKGRQKKGTPMTVTPSEKTASKKVQ